MKMNKKFSIYRLLMAIEALKNQPELLKPLEQL